MRKIRWCHLVDVKWILLYLRLILIFFVRQFWLCQTNNNNKGTKKKDISVLLEHFCVSQFFHCAWRERTHNSYSIVCFAKKKTESEIEGILQSLHSELNSIYRIRNRCLKKSLSNQQIFLNKTRRRWEGNPLQTNAIGNTCK